MKTRNRFVKSTICVLLVLITTLLVYTYKASAQPITDCRQLVTGTYFATHTGNFGPFVEVITFTKDGNYFASASNQNGDPSLNIQPYTNVQGSWKCTSSGEITATTLSFGFQTPTLPGTIYKSDIRGTFDPKAETVQATATLRIFDLDANPLIDDAPVFGTFTTTGQRVTPGQKTVVLQKLLSLSRA